MPTATTSNSQTLLSAIQNVENITIGNKSVMLFKPYGTIGIKTDTHVVFLSYSVNPSLTPHLCFNYFDDKYNNFNRMFSLQAPLNVDYKGLKLEFQVSRGKLNLNNGMIIDVTPYFRYGGIPPTFKISLPDREVLSDKSAPLQANGGLISRDLFKNSLVMAIGMPDEVASSTDILDNMLTANETACLFSYTVFNDNGELGIFSRNNKNLTTKLSFNNYMVSIHPNYYLSILRKNHG